MKFPEINFPISKELYYRLNTLTIDPKIDLEKLCFCSIGTDNNGRHSIFWFKEVFIKDGEYFAQAAMMMDAIESYDTTKTIMDALAAKMKAEGIPVKRKLERLVEDEGNS